jgi:hypothetical protein
MVNLSVCLAGIRKHNWKRLYDSIVTSLDGKYSFEMVICGPVSELPNDIRHESNVKLIKSYASPTVANHLAILEASGKYITWSADDGWFFSGKLADAIDQLKAANNKKAVYLAKYIEGGQVYSNDIFLLNYHDSTRSPYSDNAWLSFNVAIMQKTYYEELGGFDCRFEACPMAYADLATRAQRDGCQTLMNWDFIFECTQFPGKTGDHGPVHDGQVDHDQPLFREIYDNTECQNRTTIDIDNWKNQPSVWRRRFGEPISSQYKYDLSVIIPGIRHQNWEGLLDSLAQACTKYSYEVLFIGPFPPNFTKTYGNVKYLRSYQAPSVCAQQAVLEAQGKLFFLTVDDCEFLETSLDQGIDMFNTQCRYNDVVNMRYFEGGEKMTVGNDWQKWWFAWSHGDLQHAGVDKSWQISLQQVMNVDYWKELGGWDCDFEYANMANHDLMFRIQKHGGKILHSPIECCNADHEPGYSGSHFVMESLHVEHEQILFKQMYQQPNNRHIIDINNWKNRSKIWDRRFGKYDPNNLPNSYVEVYGNYNPQMPRKVLQ